MNLAAIDANLLVAFDALVAERNVSRAAKRLGRTQPAMSNALARLRKLFGDPLLVRSGRDMVPTRKARELAEPIHRALAALQGTIGSTTRFDPKTSPRRFRIAASDYVGLVLLPRLLHHLGRIAPHVDLETQPIAGKLPADDLRSGHVDLAFGSFPSPTATPLRHEALFREDFVCVSRRDHPEARKPLRLAQYVRLKHLNVCPGAERSGIVDRQLAERGLERRVAMSTSHFLLAPIVVAQTDLIATLPRRGAAVLAQRLGLRLHKVPIPVPWFVISMVWHARSDNEAASEWFREQVRLVSKKI